jgi:hypothetical protein
LHELLLVNPEENREDVVPTLALRNLKDDPTVSEAGWSFLKDSRNVALQGYDRWLLNGVANIDWLQEEFCTTIRTVCHGIRRIYQQIVRAPAYNA